jgi:flavin-dependent dehydrogenase
MAPVVRIIGGGPAGSSAALAALGRGAPVTLFEKSRLPRHKVCGEVLSPGIVPVLRSLEMEPAFFACRPAAVRRMLVRIGRARKEAVLPEVAWGLSRYRLDDLLLQAAASRGAHVVREAAALDDVSGVVAAGRRAAASRGERLFGFKAHFDGPAEDAVELYFFSRAYIGINPVEDGRLNVCGLAPESELTRFRFEVDEMLDRVPEVQERLRPLRRVMDWMTTGPLVFGNRFRLRESHPGVYPAGDALSFVDPFTGSGMLSAMMSGTLAGECAASGVPAGEYMRRCRRELNRPFQAAHLMREVIASGWAEGLIPWVPASLLFRLTRP